MLTPQEEAKLLDFSPMTTRKGEVIVVVDRSPSMTGANDKGGAISKIDLVREAFPGLIRALAGLDAAGENEEGGGGAMTWVFSDKVVKVGDVNPTGGGESVSIEEALRQIVPQGGGTYAGAALNEALDAAIDEETLDPTKPIVITLWTDGEAHDQDVVLDFLQKKVRGRVRLAVGVLGSGDEHDATVRSYQQVVDSDEAHKTHARVVSFSKMTTGQELTDAALSLFNAA